MMESGGSLLRAGEQLIGCGDMGDGMQLIRQGANLEEPGARFGQQDTDQDSDCCGSDGSQQTRQATGSWWTAVSS